MDKISDLKEIVINTLDLLGVKKYGGETVIPGNIIVRQRGTKIFPGENVGMGKDHSIFSVVKGKVVFKKSKSDRTFVSVKPN